MRQAEGVKQVGGDHDRRNNYQDFCLDACCSQRASEPATTIIFVYSWSLIFCISVDRFWYNKFISVNHIWWWCLSACVTVMAIALRTVIS